MNGVLGCGYELPDTEDSQKYGYDASFRAQWASMHLGFIRASKDASECTLLVPDVVGITWDLRVANGALIERKRHARDCCRPVLNPQNVELMEQFVEDFPKLETAVQNWVNDILKTDGGNE